MLRAVRTCCKVFTVEMICNTHLRCREHQKSLNHREDFEGNQMHVCRQLQYITAICLKLAYIMMSSETLGLETPRRKHPTGPLLSLRRSLNILHCDERNLKQFCWRLSCHLEGRFERVKLYRAGVFNLRQYNRKVDRK